MSIEHSLRERSQNSCELCAETDNLEVNQVPPSAEETVENCVLLCNTCLDLMDEPEQKDVNHWRCLNDSMWSAIPAVQVVVWRILDQLKAENWAVDLQGMMYMDEETASWAKAIQNDLAGDKHRDSNGNQLAAGDTITLIKSLDVKGGGFTAKRGTTVKNISLVDNNPTQIEGKLNGQTIVLLTKYVKKA